MLSIDAPGATATFNFTGTEVHVYGAYRCNSGPYRYVVFYLFREDELSPPPSVTIDGTKSEPMRTNGSAPSDVDSQLFQVKLFAVVSWPARMIVLRHRDERHVNGREKKNSYCI